MSTYLLQYAPELLLPIIITYKVIDAFLIHQVSWPRLVQTWQGEFPNLANDTAKIYFTKRNLPSQWTQLVRIIEKCQTLS